jgi:hypothetical protein
MSTHDQKGGFLPPLVNILSTSEYSHSSKEFLPSGESIKDLEDHSHENTITKHASFYEPIFTLSDLAGIS